MNNISPFLPVLLNIAASTLSFADKPRQFNCTNQHPASTLQGIFYHYDEEYDSPTQLGSKGATISFSLANTTVPNITQCSASLLEYNSGTNITYQCDAPSNATAGSSANFTISGMATMRLYAVNQTWTCGK
jgi:hypothetical protein